uniref:TPR_REGION domain-containing protein n=1 Tax=Rhabditophanes sp. KR3021 TaxID=114890 RepID=A0AC35U4H2_9BILA
MKKVISPGLAPIPNYGDGTKVIFHYDIYQPDNANTLIDMPEESEKYTLIDTSRKPWPHGYGKALEVVFGKKFQLALFEKIIPTMCMDEISTFDVLPQEITVFPMMAKTLRNISKKEVDRKSGKHCHDHDHPKEHRCAAMGPQDTGYKELDDWMKDPVPLRFKIHLLSVLQYDEYTHDTWQMSPEEKMINVVQFRKTGNDLLKENKIEEASIKYREALGLVDTLSLLEKPGEKEWKLIDDLNIPLYLNLSKCYLDMKQYYEAINTASEALKREPDNLKGLFRRAKANRLVGKFNEASLDYLRIKELDPTMGKTIEQEMALLLDARVKFEANKDNVYKQMFKGVSDGNK